MAAQGGKLPRHLAAALGRGHAKDATWVLVAQLELYGVPVAVVRHQLGNQKAEDFGSKTVIHVTKGHEYAIE